jgi:hypothetical protein
MNIRNLGHDRWELLFFMTLSVTMFLTISSLSSTLAAPYYAGTVDLSSSNVLHPGLSCCLQFQNSEFNTQF